MKKTPVFLAILLLPLASLFSGCETINQVTGTVFLMTPEQEAALGKQLAVDIEKQYPIYRGDPNTATYIERLGREIVASSPPSSQEIRFHLVDSDDVNAFAIPGGSIYVLRGLLSVVDDESELAGVLAHEVGHVVQRHSAKRVSQSQFYSLVGELALGENAGELATLSTSIVQSGILLRNSRQAEYEADAVAIDTLRRARMDPRGMARFLDKLGGASSGKPGGALAAVMQYTATHPLTPDRIAAVDDRIKRLGRLASSPNSDGFNRMKARYPSVK
ncbi:M48 family metalloprotease [Candidatus Sumerlaeota bacterium]|nr:M48 family metalloprotease [Candidatus Sumerlaeota bacterium]